MICAVECFYLTISVLKPHCVVTTEYGIPSDFVKKSSASLQIDFSSTGLDIHFFGGSKLLLPCARPGSKNNFVVAKLYIGPTFFTQ